jgi:hypothetical protein
VGLHLNLTYDDFVSTYIIEHDGLHSCLPIDVGVCVLGGRENMLQIVQKRKKGKENMLQSLVHTLDFFLACGGTAFKFNI